METLLVRVLRETVFFLSTIDKILPRGSFVRQRFVLPILLDTRLDACFRIYSSSCVPFAHIYLVLDAEACKG